MKALPTEVRETLDKYKPKKLMRGRYLTIYQLGRAWGMTNKDEIRQLAMETLVEKEGWEYVQDGKADNGRTVEAFIFPENTPAK